MLNAIKNKYYTYKPGEYLPIYENGVHINRREFHLYKLKTAALAADRAWMDMITRAHQA